MLSVARSWISSSQISNTPQNRGLSVCTTRFWIMTEKFRCQNCGKEITQQEYIDNDGICDGCKEDKDFWEEQDAMDEDFIIAPHY